MVYTIENTINIGLPVNVYVNGKLVEHAFYADTKKGKVRCFRHPYKVHKHRKRAIEKTIYGTVTVEPDNGAD